MSYGIGKKVKFPLGKSFGLKREVNLGGGKVLRVENDDWGHFVSVIDKDDILLWGYELAVWDEEIEELIEQAKEDLK